MAAELEQLKISYETYGLSPAAIAEDRGLEVAAVKAGLMQCSKKYRQDCGAELPGEEELNFSDSELKEANAEITKIMKYAEDEHLRFKAACYVRDDKKGRKEVVRAVAGNQQFNIFQFNESLKGLREKANAAKERLSANVTMDIQGVTV